MYALCLIYELNCPWTFLVMTIDYQNIMNFMGSVILASYVYCTNCGAPV